MSKQTVKVPDIGTDEAAEVVEVLVREGDVLEVEQSIIVLETDKASVEVPASHSGKVLAVLVKEGDQIKQGDAILELENELSSDAGNTAPVDDTSSADEQPEPDTSEVASEGLTREASQKPEASGGAGRELSVAVPDLGSSEAVEVIEVAVKIGDEVEEGDSLFVLETDKASVEVPSPASGIIAQLLVGEGDKVKQGQQVAILQSGGEASALQTPQAEPVAAAPTSKAAVESAPRSNQQPAARAPLVAPEAGAASELYAGPAVRRLARHLGIDLSKVKASGPRQRYTKEDLRNYVRDLVNNSGSGSAIPAVPAVDFAKFGEIKRVRMSKIKRATATNMSRAWLNVPHVTQFDSADITELETYRKGQKSRAEKRATKLTPLPFLLKACALSLRAEPSFNVSLDPDGEHIIEKDYVHIGMAVDTPQGLMVPVIRDVDQKDIWELAEETLTLATKAREGKLLPRDMQGGCFSISSLGAIGGEGFTPIVNTPEVGILGVSKAALRPHWDGKKFVPRSFLPLSLSYDHRAVNGADAGRFLTHLVGLLQDVEGLAG